MSRMPLVDDPSPAARDTLDRVQRAFGATPNMFRALAHSPAALASLWSGFATLSTGRLGRALGERIAVAVAQRNGCAYCLAAHTAIGTRVGIGTEELARARTGQSADPRTEAALTFALRLVDTRGHIAAADLEAVRAAGFDHAEVAEILAHVALNLFSNCVNIAFDVPLDFPAVPLTPTA